MGKKSGTPKGYIAAAGFVASAPAPTAKPSRFLHGTSNVADHKAAVAFHGDAGYSCTAPGTTYTGPDGAVVVAALHGFISKRESGTACPGVAGLGRGVACSGTIR